ncbi:MAG: acylphosphatase [Candidatus Micrarchaeia archaeon]
MRILYEIHGFVQGVGYRAYVAGIAEKIGICGFVRNASDGSVEILAIGDKDKIDKFEKNININIGNIEVKKIERHNENELSKEFMKNYNRFIIEKTVKR